MNFESSFARIINLVITGWCRSRSGNCPEKISHFDHFFFEFDQNNSDSKLFSSDHDSDLEFLNWMATFLKIMFSCETHRWWTLGQFQKIVCPTLILGYSYLVTLKMGLGLMNPAPNLEKRSQMDVSVRQCILEVGYSSNREIAFLPSHATTFQY